MLLISPLMPLPQMSVILYIHYIVVRMDNSRLPKMIFYGQLQPGESLQGSQRKWYKDVLKDNLFMLDIN